MTRNCVGALAVNLDGRFAVAGVPTRPPLQGQQAVPNR